MQTARLQSGAGFREAGKGLEMPILLSEALHQLQEAGRTVFQIEVFLKTLAAVGSHGSALGFIETAPGSEKLDRAGEGVLFHKAGASVLYLSPDIYLGRDQGR